MSGQVEQPKKIRTKSGVVKDFINELKEAGIHCLTWEERKEDVERICIEKGLTYAKGRGAIRRWRKMERIQKNVNSQEAPTAERRLRFGAFKLDKRAEVRQLEESAAALDRIQIQRWPQQRSQSTPQVKCVMDDVPPAAAAAVKTENEDPWEESEVASTGNDNWTEISSKPEDVNEEGAVEMASNQYKWELLALRREELEFKRQELEFKKQELEFRKDQLQLQLWTKKNLALTQCGESESQSQTEEFSVKSEISY